MVYDKARSGDPDYDDKQPPEHHAGNVVSAGDGVYITDQGGAVDINGAHVNLAGTTEDGDNRPTPGNVAKVASTVQDYQPEDTPAGFEATEADPERVRAIRDGQAAMIKAGQDMANGTTNNEPAMTENPTANTAGAQTADSKPKTTTSTTKTTTK